MSSSGLVECTPSSIRERSVKVPSKAPLPTPIVPSPSATVPCQLACAVRTTRMPTCPLSVLLAGSLPGVWPARFHFVLLIKSLSTGRCRRSTAPRARSPTRTEEVRMAQALGLGVIAAIRERFSSLQRGFVFLDAPGGSQVPDEVGDAVALTMREASANMGALYETSRRVGEIVHEAETRAARFLGCRPHEVIFGANMTSLDFTLSRTAGRNFAPGDEILVSSLDHDGGVAPWLELAHDRDLVVRHVELHDDTTLDYADLESKLSDRTRVVA